MRKLLLAATILAVPALAQAATPRQTRLTPYVGNVAPVYNCVPGDNSVALNGLLANGGTVNVGPGTCTLSSGLYMMVSGTTLNGAGMGNTVFVASAPLKMDMISIGKPGPLFRGSGFTISNLTLDGDLHTPAPTATGIGRGVVVYGGATQSTIANVETRFGTDGASISGSYIAVTGQYSHDNRHAGIYGHGTTALPAPYNIAANDVVTGGRYDNNTLDNTPGKTFDNLIFNNGVTGWTIGGTTPGAGNEATGNDILVSCLNCGQNVGNMTVEGNTVTNGALGGVRLSGQVHDSAVLNNTLVNDQGNAIVVSGEVQRATIQGNTMSRQLSAGIALLSNSVSPGIAAYVTITGNSISMGNPNNPTVWVSNASTQVSVTLNAYNGGHDSTAAAGPGLTDVGNN